MTCAARIATLYIHAYCRQTWGATDGDNAVNMASTMAGGSMIDVFDHKGGGSHKYIPKARLNDDLLEPEDEGVYGYWKMHDDSYLLLTCRGRLAYWTGRDDDRAVWGD